MSYKVKYEEQQIINAYMNKMGYLEGDNKVYQPWSKEDTAYLKKACRNGLAIVVIARRLDRTQTAIRLRMKKLGLNNWRPSL